MSKDTFLFKIDTYKNEKGQPHENRPYQRTYIRERKLHDLLPVGPRTPLRKLYAQILSPLTTTASLWINSQSFSIVNQETGNQQLTLKSFHSDYFFFFKIRQSA